MSEKVGTCQICGKESVFSKMDSVLACPICMAGGEFTEDDMAFVKLCAWALGKHDSLLAQAAREKLDSMQEGNAFELTTGDGIFIRIERKPAEKSHE